MNVEKQQLSQDAKIYAEKAARSVAEVQYGLHDVYDIITFLEILGYDDSAVRMHGFADLPSLANYISSFIDCYEGFETKSERKSTSKVMLPIASRVSRLSEAVAVQTPWLGAFAVLCISGISIWMARILPIDITTFFVGGVFAGLILSEGLLQMFSGILFRHYDQRNFGEIKRVLFRSYLVAAGLIGITTVVALALSVIGGLSLSYSMLFVAAMAGVLLHRVSFNLLYTLKLVKTILTAYAAGFALLIAVFFIQPTDTGLSMASRYFYSLASAFGLLSAFSIYSHIIALRKLAATGSSDKSAESVSFFKPQSIVKNSLKSRFEIQLLESVPQLISGISFFVMLFGDRLLSWAFNPQRLTLGGMAIPFTFNNQYHAGADLALFVLIPAAIIQYVLLSPLYARVQNESQTLSIRNIHRIQSLISTEYRKALMTVLAAAGASVAILNVAGQDLIPLLNGTDASLAIMRIAAFGNLALAVFTTNLVFIVYLNRQRLAAKLTVIGAVVTVGLGTVFGQAGVENIVFGYLVSAVLAAALSTALTLWLIRTHAGRALARFS